MKTRLNVFFHLLLIAWNGYFLIIQIEDLMAGILVGKALIYYSFRIAVVIFFSISFLKMTRNRETYS